MGREGRGKKPVLPPPATAVTQGTSTKHHSTRAESVQEAPLSYRSAAQAHGYSRGPTCTGGQSLIGALTFLFLLWHNPVDLVGLGDVQLGSVCHLLEVRALVQSTAQPCLPRGWLRFVTFFELAFENSPGLKQQQTILQVSSAKPLNPRGKGAGAVGRILHLLFPTSQPSHCPFHSWAADTAGCLGAQQHLLPQ